MDKLQLVAIAAGGAALALALGGAAVVRKNKETLNMLQTQGPCPDTDPTAFVARLEEAITVAKQKGAILNARAVMAQAAWESGWGTKVPGDATICSNNLFGIKAGLSWLGPTLSTPTHEVYNGQRVATSARWRVYLSWSECLVDYGRLIQLLYRGCLPHADAPIGDGDPTAWARALVSGPVFKWATDPGYADNIVSVGQSLARYAGPSWS